MPCRDRDDRRHIHAPLGVSAFAGETIYSLLQPCTHSDDSGFMQHGVWHVHASVCRTSVCVAI